MLKQEQGNKKSAETSIDDILDNLNLNPEALIKQLKKHPVNRDQHTHAQPSIPPSYPRRVIKHIGSIAAAEVSPKKDDVSSLKP